jgi:AcrR family transcriptional regulator
MTKGHVPSSGAIIEALASEELPHLQVMGRRQRHGAETRVRLFHCALQLFAERGYTNVTVEHITEAADVGKGTFFNYFESKDQVLGVMAEIQLGKVKEALTMADAGEQTICSVLHHLFLGSAEEPGRSPDLARALLSSFLASEGVRRLMAHNLASEGRKMLAQIVASRKRRLRFIFSKRLWEPFCFGRLRASLRSKLGPKKAFNTFGGQLLPRDRGKSDETQSPNYRHAVAGKPDQRGDQLWPGTGALPPHVA